MGFYYVSALVTEIQVLDNVLYVFLGDVLYSINISIGEVSDTYLDDGISFNSSVVMSRFHVQTGQRTQVFREKFYVKSMLSLVDGMVDMNLINEERGTTKTINQKHISLGRKIIVGGNSDKVKIEFTTSYDTGCAINAMNIEGDSKYRSMNKD